MSIIKNYIGGELVAAESGLTIDVINPAKGEKFTTAPDSDKNDALKAIQAASDAYPLWSKTPVSERNSILNRIADLIDENIERLAKAESLDNGKPFKLARAIDIPRASANMRFFTNAISQFSGNAYPMDDGSINYTVHDPLGVVTCISPWNLPLYLFTWKISPALAAGNTVVAKPSEVTPYTAYLFSEICIEAGLPPGVLNIIHGYGHKLGEEICVNEAVKAVSFTGSTKTGGIIASATAPLFKKLSLEMGGKNPNLIFADCDYDKMLKTSIHSSFSNQGEICLCGSRILIQDTIYDRFKKDFIAATKKLKVGDPSDPSSKLGAIVSKDHYDKILSYIEIAKSEDGVILAGGKIAEVPSEFQNGYFIEPTIIEGLDQQCRTNQEEIFGPVVTIQPFSSDEEATELANATKYGLSATIWSENTSRVHRLARNLEAGIVWVNCWLRRDLRTPFGGVKQSGVGREGGDEALHFFTEPKNICIGL